MLLCALLFGCARGAPDRMDAGIAFPDAAVDAAVNRPDAAADAGLQPPREEDDAGQEPTADAAPPDEDGGAHDAAAATCEDGAPRGDCGCPGEPGAEPAGSACDDGACVLSAECNGVGSCGSAADCAKPDASCGPRLEHAGHYYFICPSPLNWANARAACRSNPRFDLIRIDDDAEQSFLESSSQSLTSDVWLNATDMNANGQWGWMDDGTVFWQSGAAVMDRYEDWGAGEPSSNTGCVRHALGAVDDPTDDAWRKTGCSELHFFACEAAPP